MPLTELQEKFAVAYMTNGGDATKAAIEAGYAQTSARELGYGPCAIKASRKPSYLLSLGSAAGPAQSAGTS